MTQIMVPLTDLRRSPNGPRDRQLLLGDRVDILGTAKGHHHVKDATGYEGYIQAGTTGVSTTPTHMISARSTNIFEAADFKSPDRQALSFTAQITALSETDKFIGTSLGFIPKQHLQAIDNLKDDATEAAQTLIGTPYLWGGNSNFGIDCSGLIEAALRATGQKVKARDSSDQQQYLGTQLPPNSTYKRNDLLFWKGHVALVIDDTTLIHANAHHMAVAYEKIQSAIDRIKQQGDGEVTAHKRL